MKKMDVLELEGVEGGGRCEYVAGMITWFGVACLTVPTPMNIAFGGTVAAVGVLSSAACAAAWKL